MSKVAPLIPSDPIKKREWIKYQLKIRGVTLASLGRQHNISRSVVSSALYKSSPRWEHEIAHAINMVPHKVWPERYDKDHLPAFSSKRTG